MLFVLSIGIAFGVLNALPFRRNVPMRIFAWSTNAWAALAARVLLLAVGALVGGSLLGQSSPAAGADFTVGFGVAALTCAFVGSVFVSSHRPNP